MPDNGSAVLNPHLEMAKQTTVHSNLKQDIICTTNDKLQLALRDYEEALKAKQEVATCGGVFLTLLISIVTSTPQDFLKISADIWSAVFILGLFISGAVTIRALVRFYKKKNNCSIDAVCQKIMDGKDSTV